LSIGVASRKEMHRFVEEKIGSLDWIGSRINNIAVIWAIIGRHRLGIISK
jgi:hypothetical protein